MKKSFLNFLKNKFTITKLFAQAGCQTLNDSFFFLFPAKRAAKKLIEQHGFDSVELTKGNKTLRAQRSFGGKILWL